MTGQETGIPGLTIVPAEGPREHLRNALQILKMTVVADLSPKEVDKNLHSIENRIYQALKTLGTE